LLACGCAILIAGYASSGWTTIGPDQAGLLRRFGQYQGVLAPGLHPGWPWPVDHVTVVAPERVHSLELGFRAAGALDVEPLRWESTHGRQPPNRGDDESLLLTGDGRYVELAATLQYSTDSADPLALKRYAFQVADVENALRPIAESVVRDVLGRRELQELLTGARHEAEVAAAQLLHERLRAYRFGVLVRGVSFQDLHPPLAVVDSYRDVSRASSDRQRRINEANAYHDRTLAKARGKSQAMLQGAQAARAARLAEAAAGADTFRALGAARRNAPSITDFRLFWEKLAPALAGKPKVILDEEPGRRRHLILPSMTLDQAVPAIQ
jgi:HflK protein